MFKTAAIALSAAFLFAAAAQAQTLQSIPSMPLSQFQDSLGVNIHIEYTDGEYAQYGLVAQALEYIGIRNVRDAMPNPAAWAQGALQHMDALAGYGVRFDLLLDCNADFTTQMQQVDALVQQYPGSVLSVEGPNEINNYPCTTGSGTSQQQATQAQQQLYSYTHNDSLLSGVPVLYMTGADLIDLGANPGLADDANIHPYPYYGVEPFSRIESAYAANFANMPSSQPRQITESGYFTLPGMTSGVDVFAQAEMTLNLYFDAALQGNTRTYIYQLADPYNNGTSDSNFGFYNYDESAKPIANALHNLHDQIPWDTASSPVPVQAQISGLPAGTGNALALTGSDGSIYLFLWNELPVWNATTQTRIDNPYVPVYVTMPGSWTVDYFTPSGDETIQNLPQQPDGSYGIPVVTFPTALIFRPPAAAQAMAAAKARAAAAASAEQLEHAVQPTSGVTEERVP